ncbi:hypothetical protein JIG36_09050 [Actinoplanes sp. LDG1-06]|uniref:Uncharacterized protein n=1 Tax=Paractinoplanes ovalisporus TaxID=2810368 RepID=A0ABS2A790_9ACTN|nr:hypothetical protein [Actinoplanes ovalisporus]MBM2615699.1 hypothetical protein [Actinoplanes ovalisporus]
MSSRATVTRLDPVPRFLLHNRHAADDCGVVFAAFRGFPSPLRHAGALSSCRTGGHEVWWQTTAPDGPAALRQLPPYVAATTVAIRIERLDTP